MKVMTQENISLLIKDLSTRLSYGVICQVDDGASGLNDGKLVEIDISKELVRFDADYYWDAYIDDVKPYLRLLSSMTEEEFIYFMGLRGRNFSYHDICQMMKETFNMPNSITIVTHLYNYLHKMDWLLSNHFDVRGLIPRGLAIEVTEENNPYKE